MTLRTPRRRISPRAKRRCRAIRDFFRRALGSSSQKDIEINSSIAVNVTDLKHQIVGIERQLDQVNKNCENLACIENTLRKEADNILAPECTCQHEIVCLAESTVDFSDRKSMISTAKNCYKRLDTLRRKSDESEYVSKEYRNIKERKLKTLPASMAHEQQYSISKHRHRKSKGRLHVDDKKIQKRRTRSTLEAFGDATSYTGTSYHSLAQPLLTECQSPNHHQLRKHYKHNEKSIDESPGRRHKHHLRRKKSESPERYHEDIDQFQEEPNGYLRKDKPRRNRKNIKERSKIDSDFISNIIQKQYRPTNMFGRRRSEISQISAPVCRDQEYSLRENIQEGVDLCSCCYEREAYRTSPHRSTYRSTYRSPHRSPHNCTLPCDHHNYYDTGSVCDARLYRTKRPRVPRRYRYVDMYNDATLYDVVPVKEKSSPKSKRKFVEDNITGYEYYREVPPSPRTHRPRLNLKAQHGDYEEYMMTKHAKQSHFERQKRHFEHPNVILEGEDVYSDMVQNRFKYKQLNPRLNENSNGQHNDNATVSASRGHLFENMNKTHDVDGPEKGDKTLDEIKYILQSFLQEIKKEPTPQDKEGQDRNIQTTNASGATDGSGVPGNIGVTPIGAHVLPTVPSFTVAQCSIPNQYTPFTNPCCCPMPPMCPLSCMQNVCQARPTCSYHIFPPNQEARCQECSQNTRMQDTDNNRDTDELIKEIYKLVTLNPRSERKKTPDRRKDNSEKKLTSRSVGDSICRVSRHDAKVATSALKCYSKSCEAIGSPMITETSYTTRSDTAIEKLSLDISQSDTEFTTAIRAKAKPKNKLTNVFKGLFKKKKTDTESSFEVDIVPKVRHLPPFRQEIINYAMHEQEFYNKPSYASGYDRYGYVPPPPGCEHRGPYYPRGPSVPHGAYTPHRRHEQTIPEHAPHYHHSHTHPAMPPYQSPYDPYCNHHAPQVPLCLKEVVVKSTGTQSDRKMSFFHKLGRRTPLDERTDYIPPQPRFTEGTQTFAEMRRTQKLASEPSKPLFPGWKKFQDKVQKDLSEDPLMYNYKMKQKLQDGDKKLKSTMVKKMFNKRNPFSPNNLIIRTLLGNDPSSFGEPNVTLKPRMFF
ncbi:hypothetical protein O0L34_g6764 [Tuta absoluta]|nr:hypothetical protein O0L34_g6764 [Tuta absoluta]